MPNFPSEAYENERYYGLAWRPPALLERPHWSDEDGAPLNLQETPNEERGCWKVDVNLTTDSDGWLYASVFKHLDYPRPGGRAGRRVGDFVRRRRWKRFGQDKVDKDGKASTAENVAHAAEAVASTLISPVSQMQGIKVRKQTELDRRKGAVKMFLGMLTNTIKRRQLWSVMPMDPAAWFVMLSKHQAELVAQQSAVLAVAPPPKELLAPSAEAAGQENSGGDRPPNLVRDLVCAAVHSRAAYGHAMAAGHLASVYSFALLQTLHQFNFNPVGGASGEANNQAVAALAGIPVEDIKLAEWHNSIARPCHYLAVDRANHCIVLSIRGSLEIGDILSDLTAKPLEIFGMLGTEGLVHEGLMAAATYVQCNTAPALEVLAKSHPGWPLLITGHSMGGSVASILTLLMVEGGGPPGLGPVRCIAIGPAPVFSRPLAEVCNDFVTSIVLGADVVPRVSYASVEGLFLEFSDSSPIGNIGKRVSKTLENFKVDWPSAFRSPLPCTPSLPNLSGLKDLVSLAGDDESAARAARTAKAAAAATAAASANDVEGNEDDRPASAIELVDRQDTSSSRGATGRPMQYGGSSAAASKSTGEYRFSTSLSSADASSAASKLAFLREQSQDAQQSRQSEEKQAPPPFKESKSAEKHQVAAEVLDIEGDEFRDLEGHPKHLFLAGRVLWLMPPKEKEAPEMSTRAAKPSSHMQMTDLRHMQMTDLRRADEGSVAGEEAEEKDPDLQRSPAKKRPASSLRQTSPQQHLRSSQEFPSLAVYQEESQGGGLVRAAEVEVLRDSRAQSSPKRSKSSEQAVDGEMAFTELTGSPEIQRGVQGSSLKRKGPLIVEVDRERFARILLTIEMMQDHLPDNYMATINQL